MRDPSRFIAWLLSLLLAAVVALFVWVAVAGAQVPDTTTDELPDHRAAYIQGSNKATITYLSRADSALAAGDTAYAGAMIRQARGRARSLAL